MLTHSVFHFSILFPVNKTPHAAWQNFPPYGSKTELIVLLIQVLIFLVASMLWLATVCQFAFQVYDDYWQQSQLWSGEEDTGGNRDLVRIGRAYIRLSDEYERAEWEETAHFINSKGYAFCYYFSFCAALTGTITLDDTERSSVQYPKCWTGGYMHARTVSAL
jgi:hypothetical protein